MKHAERSVVYAVMRGRGPMKPYEITGALRDLDIYVSDITITRQFRRWKSDIDAIPPAPGSEHRTWKYQLRDGA